MIDREFVMDLRTEIKKIAREEVKKAIEEHDRTTDKRTETHTCDLIDRQAAIKAILKVPDGNWNQKRFAQEIRKLPSVDSVPVRRGKWVY